MTRARAASPLEAAVDDSVEDLRAEPDARRAIVRCYARFERAAAASGVERKPWSTPMEFMREALRRLPLPRTAVPTLTGLFELARFSHHPLGPSERDRALAALDEIRTAMRATGERCRSTLGGLAAALVGGAVVVALVALAAMPAYLALSPSWRPVAVRLVCAAAVIAGCVRALRWARGAAAPSVVSPLDAPRAARGRPGAGRALPGAARRRDLRHPEPALLRRDPLAAAA